MSACYISDARNIAIAIVPICQNDFTSWFERQPSRIRSFVYTNMFTAKPNTFCLLIDQKGNLEKILLGIATQNDFLAFGILPKVLPNGCYYVDAPGFSLEQLERAAVGFGMGSYQFTQYKDQPEVTPKLLCKDDYSIDRIKRTISSVFLVRDLINMPACDLYPEKLAEVADALACEFNAKLTITAGEELRKNFPAVYAVGCSSKRQPLLIDLQFGNQSDPKVILVGKGVCFDSGGLHLKSATNMSLMKKDMAGAAHALGLARMVMSAKLPINLRVIIPAVENLISWDSLKPGDIIRTRKGWSVEILSTDAEGRLILADALTLASECKPKLIVDFASLTSAATVALGMDIAALFTSDDTLASDIAIAMAEEQDPVWRMPIYQPYLNFLKSEVADFKNMATPGTSDAGAITATLFLQQFVAKEIRWAHFDMIAYNIKSKPGKPEGGEAMCLRGLFRYLSRYFSV